MAVRSAFIVNKETGLLNVDFYSSPNCDQRPEDTVIDLLVIHNISLPPGVFTGNAVSELFLNKLDFTRHDYYKKLINSRLSAHVFIRRDGSVMQFVPFHLRAWHAGVSCFKNRTQCNDFSIGIELEGADDILYTDIQYQQLSALAYQLMRCYPAIVLDHIVGHKHIAPERKTDPGAAFKWDYFHQLLEKEA